MAIEINKPAGGKKVEPPTITLNGVVQNNTTGDVGGEKLNVTIGENNIVQNGLVVNHREEIIFRDAVDVTLTPDPNFKSANYPWQNESIPYNEVTKSTLTVVGERPSGGQPRSATTISGLVYSGGTIVNDASETYYTLNGKSPKRTKSNLYTGTFKVRRNTSGTDNIILKTRTYADGRPSEVRTFEFRITKKDSNSTTV